MKEERTQIKLFLWQNGLSNNWLICELKKREIDVDKSTFCEILNGRRNGEKAELVIQKSVEILKLYETNFANV